MERFKDENVSIKYLYSVLEGNSIVSFLKKHYLDPLCFY